MYPKSLDPAYTEEFVLETHTVEIPKCVIQFQKWNGPLFKDTFGHKPLVSVDGEPMFAEMAIRTHFINDGWQARWIQTYGRRNKEPICLSEWKDDSYANQTHDAIEDTALTNMLREIARLNNNSYAGCWDIVAWKQGQLVFAEAKRNNKDSIRQTQTNWLAAGLSFGLKPQNFLLVQWDFNPRCMS